MRTRGLIKADTLAQTKAIRKQIKAIDKPKPPKPPKGVGRHPVITQKVLDLLEAAFTFGCTDEEACAYAGISTGTFYAYQAENPQMLELKHRLRKMPAIKARNSVISSFKTRPELALRYLEDTIPDEFNSKTTIKHEGEVAINFSQELKERTKKYEPKPSAKHATPQATPPDVERMES